ncbi:Oligopeptidase A [Thalassocella blandensis]|nr:Oligopeptidase A [Thalassocella blandensis]
MTNPLLQDSTLPPFSQISAEHVVPAMQQLIADAEAQLQQRLASVEQPSWETLIEPIEAMQDKINQAWSPVSHLNAVVNTEELRKAYEEAEQALTAYYTAFGQNKALFEAYQKIEQSPEFTTLSQAQQQSVRHAVRDFKLSGVGLEGNEKEQFKKIKARLSTLTTTFSNNVLDATNGWYYHFVDADLLQGLPEFLVTGAVQAAKDRDMDGYVLTLDLPVYFTVMSQAQSEELRKIMYEAYNTRASSEGPSADKWDNTDIIEEIMQLRQQLASLLGFENYAEVSLASKMAESPELVVEFLQDLARKTKPFAEKELKELKQFAQEKFGLQELNAWDVPYISEQLKLEKYNVSQETLRPYFPLPVVQQGLFKVAGNLFGVEVREAATDTWHQDAKYYEILRDGKKIASFYFDLFARAGKRGGAWMAECRSRRIKEGELQLPVAYLVCNFNSPVEGKPCLLTHNEVTTLFHEFGHGLHHMLTQIDVASVSGITGVEWDAVELPSQFMENFCWQPEVLSFLSQHYESGEPLPETLLANVLAAKNFQSAMFMLRQLEFALFDLRLHLQYGKQNFSGVQALLDEVRSQVAVFMPPAFNKFQNGFSHIFAGGYAAGYYSYKWAEVLSADAFSAFEEEGIFNPATGQRFMHEILERGGSQNAMTLFKNFRGREPSAEALMRHSGLVEDNAA